MDESTGPPAARQAVDLRLRPSPDGLEVVRVFRRPGSQVVKRDRQHLSSEELKEALKIAVPAAQDLARNGRPVTQQDMDMLLKQAGEVVRFKRARR